MALRLLSSVPPGSDRCDEKMNGVACGNGGVQAEKRVRENLQSTGWSFSIGVQEVIIRR